MEVSGTNLRGKRLRKGLTKLDLYTFIRRRNLQENFTFFFKSVGKHLKSVGGRRLKKSVDYRVNR